MKGWIPIKIKLKKALRLILIFLFISQAKFIVLAIEPASVLDVKKYPITWTSGLNNNVRIINFDDGVKYFKECKKKLNIKDTVDRIISEYFGEYLNNFSFNDKELLTKTLSEKNNLKKFVDMGFLWEPYSRISKYLKNEIDTSCLGVPLVTAQKLNIDLKEFFSYASREFVQRDFFSFQVKEGELQIDLALKTLAAYRLARYLGIDDIIQKPEFVELLTKHGSKLGILTNQANGKDVSTIKNLGLKVAPNFQRQLINLQVLDTITNEYDHNPKNCFFQIKNDKIVDLVAFDNEGGFWGKNFKLKKGLRWEKIPSLVATDKKIRLPHMSKSLAEKILKTTDLDIENILNDLLTADQINSVKKRFNCLKSSLINTILYNNNFLLSDDQWSQETIRDELHGNYENTYLKYFCHKLNLRTNQ